MAFCPFCGSEVNSASVFCENCGKKIKDESQQASPQPQQPSYQPQQDKYYSPPPVQRSAKSGGIEYDDTICLILCCCLSPIAALIYYLLTDHDSYEYNRNY